MTDFQPAIRAEALESLLIEKGLLDPAAVDRVIEQFNDRTGPMNGARVVARAWTDADFKERLLHEGSLAVEEYAFEGGQIDKLVVVANTGLVHNLVVCTLCSCYPWALLGLPPKWYKDPSYRARSVREPRAVLREFGVALAASTDVRVWDSSAEIRYMVLPQQPPEWVGLEQADLAHRITRDSMIGVGLLSA